MKRITSIELNNFRAFYGRYPPIELSNGESILIYGENGSGKSSIFKAVSNFFASSRNVGLPYIKNSHQPGDNGEVSLVFKEYDDTTRCIISKIGQSITFGSQYSSTEYAQFVKDTELTKGFLDYRSLLDVYNHRDKKPNLFKLIVTELLLDFIPPGGTYSFGKKWNELEVGMREVYTRRVRSHQRGLIELPAFEAALRKALDSIFLQLNFLLIRYFKFNLRISYQMRPMLPYNYTGGNWHITGDLRLNLKLDGVDVIDQSDYLNEARLSALSICLYLATLLRNPQLLEYKILFLDDVFIGLDAGNRIPILNILKNEFREYQIFISTYDRHWFELAKRYSEVNSPNRWKTVEFYVGSHRISKIQFTKPIVITGETNYERASQYLHSRIKPDYPASANYFRKALEEIIQDYVPKWEIADTENTQIPDYQLTALCFRTKSFFHKIGKDVNTINTIISLLPVLLHPLSHHEISSPVYKGELKVIEQCIVLLKKQLIVLEIPMNYKCCLEGNKKIRLTFVIDAAANHICYYDILLREPLTLIRNDVAPHSISECNCHADKSYGTNGANPYKTFNPDKRLPQFNYTSIANAYSKIHSYLSGQISPFPLIDEISASEYHDGMNWQPLANIMTW